MTSLGVAIAGWARMGDVSTLPRAVCAAAFGLSFECGSHKLGKRNFPCFCCRFAPGAALPLCVAALLRCQRDGISLEQGRRQVVPILNLLCNQQLGMCWVEDNGGDGNDGRNGSVRRRAGVA